MTQRTHAGVVGLGGKEHRSSRLLPSCRGHDRKTKKSPRVVKEQKCEKVREIGGLQGAGVIHERK